MSKLSQVNGAVAAIWHVIARYPAVSAGLANVVIVIAAKFGLHLSANQVVETATATATILGILVHMGVIPVTKVDNVKSGLKSKVPDNTMVANVETAAKPPEAK